MTLRLELGRLSDMKTSRRLYRDAVVASRLGRTEKAVGLAERALEKDPENQAALSLLQTLNSNLNSRSQIAPIRLQTGAPVTISFQDASFKDAVLALGRAYGVNMIFDADLQDRGISVYADRVDFAQAFELLLKSNRAFYRRLGKNSVVIAHDTPGKRAEYEDYLVRTFFVRSGDAQTIADALTLTLGLQTVSVDIEENAITVRDTPDRLLLADQLISVKDRRPAEVVIEVEVLQVNRTKSEQLGLDFGTSISVTPPDLLVSDVFPVNEFGDALGASALSLPTATLQLFKQDVDARTLASPRIRALHNTAAKFHVGDQVPLRASEVIDTTGGTRTTFEYRDIGIRLNIKPQVRLNSSVGIELSLEVSTLGENLGTVDDPAYVIGTRKIETKMLLQDGETAIIGGLIRDEDRNTIRSVPGLGNIPVIGRLFRQRDGQGSRTDIILTLSPRVVRPRDLPPITEAEFFSGTGTRVSAINRNDFLAQQANGDVPTIRLDLSGAAATPVPAPTPSQPSASGGVFEPVLSFDKNAYDAAIGEIIDVNITAGAFPPNSSGQAIIGFRKELVAVEAVQSDFNLPFSIEAENGLIRLELTPQVAGVGTRKIATIKFRGKAPGLSYLIFGNAVGAGGAQGLPGNTTLRNSRILVR